MPLPFPAKRGKICPRLLALVLICTLVCACSVSAQQPASSPSPENPQTVRISVLSLFHPAELCLGASPGAALHLEIDGHNLTLTGNANSCVTLAANGRVQFQPAGNKSTSLGSHLRAHPETITSSRESPRFWLEVPGKLRREYTGALEIRSITQKHQQSLESVITMPLEIAVASVVQAESPPAAGMEALKAQAVATRSFLVARQAAHTGFDFCDTTHCQFLRSPPAPESLAARATLATTGLILTWRETSGTKDLPLAAMYARSCGGRTRTLREIGLPSGAYPYYAVHCAYCARHPEEWKRQSSAPAHLSERDRLAYNRIHGWGAIPSIATPESNGPGKGIGHGLGLCQLGGLDMALHGSDFAQILAHYYPNTRLTNVP